MAKFNEQTMEVELSQEDKQNLNSKKLRGINNQTKFINWICSKEILTNDND